MIDRDKAIRAVNIMMEVGASIKVFKRVLNSMYVDLGVCHVIEIAVYSAFTKASSRNRSEEVVHLLEESLRVKHKIYGFIDVDCWDEMTEEGQNKIRKGRVIELLEIIKGIQR